MRQEDDRISSNKVGLRPLAAPDVLEFDLPDKHICIISDDGSHISMELAKHLRSRGWCVVVLRYYHHDEHNAVANEEERVDFGETSLLILTDDDEAHIRQQLDIITSHFGPPAVFIHVHPHFTTSPYPSVTFDAYSESVLRQVFLTAKYLQPFITAAAQQPVSGTRSCFMTVTQLDGGFGLCGERDIDVIAGGLSGLTKTLALEWPNVFCRAVDVSPDVDNAAVQHILAELNDPNRRYVEVGWRKIGRVTPEVQS